MDNLYLCPNCLHFTSPALLLVYNLPITFHLPLYAPLVNLSQLVHPNGIYSLYLLSHLPISQPPVAVAPILP